MTWNLKKLNEDDYIMLENLMEKVPDPNETYTATGWHYELTALRREACNSATDLSEDMRLTI